MSNGTKCGCCERDMLGVRIPHAEDVQALAAFLEACRVHVDLPDELWIGVGKVVRRYIEQFVEDPA